MLVSVRVGEINRDKRKRMSLRSLSLLRGAGRSAETVTYGHVGGICTAGRGGTQAET